MSPVHTQRFAVEGERMPEGGASGACLYTRSALLARIRRKEVGKGRGGGRMGRERHC